MYKVVTCFVSVLSCHLYCFCTKLSLALFLYQSVTCFVSVPSYHLLCFCPNLFVALSLHQAIACCVSTPSYHLLRFCTQRPIARSIAAASVLQGRDLRGNEAFGFCTARSVSHVVHDRCVSLSLRVCRSSPTFYLFLWIDAVVFVILYFILFFSP